VLSQKKKTVPKTKKEEGVTNPIDIQGRIRTHKTQERMDQKSESENAP
jgi:hypothetical protein